MMRRAALTPPAFEQPVYVTRPLLPDIDTFVTAVREIWDRQWLTNKGPVHDALERALSAYLRAPHLSLVVNGTTALTLALRAFGLSGEVVTTPFTYPATVNAIAWCGLTPVFADVDPAALTLDPAAVKRAITPRTAAIVPVHVYGMPCRVEALQDIAAQHSLRLIYDGAHAFGTELDDAPVLDFGDATILSFHATKLFNTGEGGAVAARDPEIKRRVDLLKTHGIADEVSVVLPGTNARMTELAAALGLANLDGIEAERARRGEIADVYRQRLAGIEGLTTFDFPVNVRQSRPYFVLRIEDERCRLSRDALNERLKQFNVFPRRYFYPLCSEYSFYRDLPSADPRRLPVAHRAAKEVLCLPFYGALGTGGAHRICDIVRHLLEV